MEMKKYDDIKYQRNHYGIYCIECVSTNTKYIGQTFENFIEDGYFINGN